MAIIVKKDGMEIEINGDTLKELKLGLQAVREALQEPMIAPKRIGRPPKQTAGVGAPTGVDKNKTALAFLRAINGRTDGIPVSEFCTILGLQNKRTIGTSAGVTNRVLKDLGFARDSVYMRVKKTNQEKKWYPKAKMADAIAAIEETAGNT